MSTQLQLRRGTTAQNNSFTGAAGEVSVDTQTDNIRVHDGSTAEDLKSFLLVQSFLSAVQPLQAIFCYVMGRMFQELLTQDCLQ